MSARGGGLQLPKCLSCNIALADHLMVFSPPVAWPSKTHSLKHWLRQQVSKISAEAAELRRRVGEAKKQLTLTEY
eukprot:4756851-Amphidinium_carterae.1